MPKKPDMRAYFAARIDHYVNGMMARSQARQPADVAHVAGDVTDTFLTVTMRDSTRHLYRGGRYAARKVNGCYAPLQPTYVGICDGLPLTETTCPDRAAHL